MATKKRIFIGFAIEDKQARDLLRGQAKLGDSPIDYTDMSVKHPWDSSWKTQCRQHIRGCDGFIALLSKNVRSAEGARWGSNARSRRASRFSASISTKTTTTNRPRSRARG